MKECNQEMNLLQINEVHVISRFIRKFWCYFFSFQNWKAMTDNLSPLNHLLYIFFRFCAQRVMLKRFPTFCLSSRQVGEKGKQEEGELDLRSDQGRQDAPSCHFKWRQDSSFRQRQHCHLILNHLFNILSWPKWPQLGLCQTTRLSYESSGSLQQWLTLKKSASCTDCLNLMKAMHDNKGHQELSRAIIH